MDQQLRKSAQKVQEALSKFNYELKVVEFKESTRTSIEAANQIGCSLGQIAKSLVFQTKQTNRPIMVIASGSNYVDEKKIKHLVNENIRKGDAAFVLEQTGYAIGGIPPVGHKNYIEVYIDEDLKQYDTIWSAAGTPHAVFELTPQVLESITNGKFEDIKK